MLISLWAFWAEWYQKCLSSFIKNYWCKIKYNSVKMCQIFVPVYMKKRRILNFWIWSFLFMENYVLTIRLRPWLSQIWERHIYKIGFSLLFEITTFFSTTQWRSRVFKNGAARMCGQLLKTAPQKLKVTCVTDLLFCGQKLCAVITAWPHSWLRPCHIR